MHRSVMVVILLAMVVIAADALWAGPILPDLAPGSQYQLIFVTSDTIVGTYGTEAPYNALVNTDAAALNTLLASAGITGITWSAITSTADGVEARYNAPWEGVPVYRLDGVQVNYPNTSLYSASFDSSTGLSNPVLYDQAGFVGPVEDVWTGSEPTGGNTQPQYFALGGSRFPYYPYAVAVFGRTDATSDSWLYAGNDVPSDNLSLYGLSSVITVPAPEPGTLALAVAGAMAFVVIAQRKT